MQPGVAVEHVFMLDAIEIRRKGPKVSQAKLKITWSDFFCYILSLLSPPANQVWCDMGTAPLGGNLRLRDRQIFLVPIGLAGPWKQRLRRTSSGVSTTAYQTLP